MPSVDILISVPNVEDAYMYINIKHKGKTTALQSLPQVSFKKSFILY